MPAPARSDAGTASQLIPGVGRAIEGGDQVSRQRARDGFPSLPSEPG